MVLREVRTARGVCVCAESNVCMCEIDGNHNVPTILLANTLWGGRDFSLSFTFSFSLLPLFLVKEAARACKRSFVCMSLSSIHIEWIQPQNNEKWTHAKANRKFYEIFFCCSCSFHGAWKHSHHVNLYLWISQQDYLPKIFGNHSAFHVLGLFATLWVHAHAEFDTKIKWISVYI